MRPRHYGEAATLRNLALSLALIYRSAWKGNSPKSISMISHSLPLWERRMASFPALELIAQHKIWEQ
jgi:hypothetical protein